ncbi:hypothetical protein TNCV_277791 [Trichonephila clavipes]|nr:hypothetical protein TNCV_277791 [Trichonephila clavipes]
MVLYLRKKGSLPYMCTRTSEGASNGPKAFCCERSTCVFLKLVSMAGDTLHAKVGSRLDTFPNRPTTSTGLRTRLLFLRVVREIQRGRLQYFEADMAPKLARRRTTPRERTLSRLLYPTSDRNNS